MASIKNQKRNYVKRQDVGQLKSASINVIDEQVSVENRMPNSFADAYIDSNFYVDFSKPAKEA